MFSYFLVYTCDHIYCIIINYFLCKLGLHLLILIQYSLLFIFFQIINIINYQRMKVRVNNFQLFNNFREKPHLGEQGKLLSFFQLSSRSFHSNSQMFVKRRLNFFSQTTHKTVILPSTTSKHRFHSSSKFSTPLCREIMIIIIIILINIYLLINIRNIERKYKNTAKRR